jgi:hypothetical protein
MLNAMANARPAPLLRIVPPLASLPAPARDSLERADAHVARALAATIAGDVGYRCEFAFAKAFKRRVGLPPGVFRRLARAARTARVPGAAPVFRAAA